MKTLFKKLDITGVAVLLLAFFVAVGFTAATEMRQAEWYEVEIIDENEDHDEPENQGIGALLPDGPEGDCEDGTENICAVELQLASGSPFPANMHEADSLPSVQILDESFRD